MKALFAVLFAASVHVTAQELRERDTCGANYQACNPSGATSTTPPAVGGSMSSLYVDLVDSVQSVSFSNRRRTVSTTSLNLRDNGPICCAQGTQCLLLHSLNIAFCYDKFTTNYHLPDGSYGQIASGAYTAADGSSVNLLSGAFTGSNGTQGNIYSANTAAIPNTATLSVPPQWTSSGVGSAIPVTGLAQVFTYTTFVPATTLSPTTIQPITYTGTVVPASTYASTVAVSTASPVVSSQSTISQGSTLMTTVQTTQAASTVEPSTKPGSTITALTTIFAHSTTLTSTVAASSSGNVASASPSAKHGGAVLTSPSTDAAIAALLGVAALVVLV
ncbi:hypothetical protein LTR66_003034 [Elasticomyces elasticus]|nr:hypothetical protein LTR66_003034 [Elasticomyces elasticus]